MLRFFERSVLFSVYLRLLLFSNCLLAMLHISRREHFGNIGLFAILWYWPWFDKSKLQLTKNPMNEAQAYLFEKDCTFCKSLDDIVNRRTMIDIFNWKKPIFLPWKGCSAKFEKSLLVNQCFERSFSRKTYLKLNVMVIILFLMLWSFHISTIITNRIDLFRELSSLLIEKGNIDFEIYTKYVFVFKSNRRIFVFPENIHDNFAITMTFNSYKKAFILP